MTKKEITLPLLLGLLQSLEFPHKLGICERFYGRRLKTHGICWVKTGAGLNWKLDLADPCHRWVVYGKYEGSHFIDWARKFLRSDSVVVDSGANIGQMLIYLAQGIVNGRILAFEPGKEQADWLEECLKVNSELPVELIRLGLGDSTSNLYLRNLGPLYTHGSWNQVSESEGEPIKIVCLSDELASRSITTVDLWKLDVEGYEIQALRGAEKLLKERLVRALYIELVGERGKGVRDYLATFGYNCYLFSRSGELYSPKIIPDFTNGLFLPK